MIEIKNITIYTKKDSRALIQDFNLSIQREGKFAIIGEEGNGKSTLLELIYDEHLISDYCTYEGKIIRKYLFIRISFSGTNGEEKQMTIIDFFKENNWNKGLLKAMDDFGIESLVSEKKIGFLSGGERFKYRFLQLLALDPDVLLLEEPTNDLDIQTMEWLEVFIQKTTT
ncbi:ATP-binding cassette domain-containing protein [Paenibacillus sp. UNC451MF]|uniref:ATP-binding cassette domain-containing protein n=1 Tax=Paenibacillus sp. UNC451MF TaxID=1449063 RepID=UPI000A3E30E5|nr:ATP-binding cassette domain-containing protein [Paenibacillus sp. UNC451MF]